MKVKPVKVKAIRHRLAEPEGSVARRILFFVRVPYHTGHHPELIEAMKKYRRILSYYNTGIGIDGFDGRLKIQLPKSVDEEIRTIHNTWFEENVMKLECGERPLIAEIIIADINRQSLDLIYAAEAVSVTPLKRVTYVGDFIELEFSCKYVRSEKIDESADRYINAWKNFTDRERKFDERCEELREKTETYVANLKAESTTNETETMDAPSKRIMFFMTKPPLVYPFNDTESVSSAHRNRLRTVYMNSLDNYSTKIDTITENGKLIITIPENVARLIRDFHNAWSDGWFDFDVNGPVEIMIADIDPKTYKRRKALLATSVVPLKRIEIDDKVSPDGETRSVDVEFAVLYYETQCINYICDTNLELLKIIENREECGRIDKV